MSPVPSLGVVVWPGVMEGGRSSGSGRGDAPGGIERWWMFHELSERAHNVQRTLLVTVHQVECFLCIFSCCTPSELIFFVQLVGFPSLPRDLRMFRIPPIALLAEWIISSTSVLTVSPFGLFNKEF